MDMSLTLILECLSDFNCDNHILPQKRIFKHIRLYDQEFFRPDPDTAYVALLSVAMGVSAEFSDACFICLRDRFKQDDETDSVVKNKIIVTENINLIHLYTKLKSYFDTISEWTAAMWEEAARGTSLQNFLNLSIPVIGNTINVSDSSMRLIASTDTETDDGITLRLRENGCHTAESKELFRKAGCYEQWNTRQSIYTQVFPELGPYLMVNKIFKFRDVYFMHVVMVCDHRPFTPGLIDLFQMLLDVLETYVDKQRNDIIKISNSNEQLITDLIENDPEKHDSIKSRLYTAGIPYIGNFRVIVASPAEQSRAPLSSLRSAIQTALPDAFMAVYHQRVIALSRTTYDLASDESSASVKKLNDLLENQSCQCGISSSFTSLSEFPEAYSQAAIALRFSTLYCRSDHLPDLRDDPDAPNVWFYETFSMLYPVSERLKTSVTWQKSPYWLTVKQLYMNDVEHDTNNVEILYYFLRHERHGSRVAQILHMHRNNVAYRIGRICETTGLDLDDADVRFNLMLALLMLKTLTGQEML